MDTFSSHQGDAPLRQAILASLAKPRVRVFLKGPPGSGKTTLAVERLRWLIRQAMPTTAILVLLPQRLLGTPYHEVLRDPELGPAGQVDVITLDGLARRLVGLFWPLTGERAGFAHPTRPPVFLTVETAQYFMEGIVAPLIEREGYFEGITIERTRLLSQLLDNLNKASLIGISLAEVADRLKGAWTGDAAQRLVFDQAADCIQQFRAYCLAHNLLDFSLQLETFVRHLYPQPAVRAYLFERYRHLIVDNLEEDTPVLHDVLFEWVRHCESALIVVDDQGGHRLFLGADPVSAARLADVCEQKWELQRSFVASPDVLHLAHHVGLSLNRRRPGDIRPPDPDHTSEPDFRRILHRQADQEHRFHPQMLDWVSGQINRLMSDEGVLPEEIVVVAPFVGDALRFALLGRLSALGIPARSHRPSRALREEPAARCMLTLARLAHPRWQLQPPVFDVVLALVQAIAGLDLVRARLLTDIVYRPRAVSWLGTFAAIEGDMRARITPEIGERYDMLRNWLVDYADGASPQPGGEGGEVPLDRFLGLLFGEVLSQEGFGFHGPIPAPADLSGRPSALDNARVVANLIESARKFRDALELVPDAENGEPIGARFVRMVERGLMAASYVEGWRLARHDAVLLAPAYSYLMTNRPVDYQFWLDVGSTSWWERIYQPLTHPYVLRRDWEPGRPWTDEDEFNARQESLYRLVLGLTYRCRKGVFLGMSDLNEQGYEQRGPLLQAIQSALRRVGR